jgi:hypothetical protein
MPVGMKRAHYAISFTSLGPPSAIIPRKDSLNGKILIQVGPMQTKRRNFNVIELIVRLSREARIPSDGKCDLQPTFHRHVDFPASVLRRNRLINQCAHSRIEL